MSTLIVYKSNKGFIREVAESLQKDLSGPVDLLDLKKERPGNLQDYDTIIISGSFHAGRIPGKLLRYTRKYEKDLLNKRLILLIGGLDAENFQSSLERNFPAPLREHCWKTVHAGGRYLPEQYGKFIQSMMSKIAGSSEPQIQDKTANIEALVKELNTAAS